MAKHGFYGSISLSLRSIYKTEAEPQGLGVRVTGGREGLEAEVQ